MLKLALRNMFRQRARTAVTLMAIIFGVVGLSLSGGFVHDIYIQLGEALIHSQSGHLQVYRAGFFEHGTRHPEKFLIADPEGVRRQIKDLSAVEDVMIRLNFSGLINNGRTDWSIMVEGVEPEKEASLTTHIQITSGRQLEKHDAFGILVGHGVAQALKLKPGDRVTLLVNSAEGAINSLEFEVVGVFKSFSKEFDARAARISLLAAQELLVSKGANSLVVSLKQTAETDRVAAIVAGLLDARILEVKTWVELNDFYTSTVALYDRQFGVLQFIVLIMVLLSVVNSVNMNILERVGEFGTMMALGVRNQQIFRLVVVENALMGLGGASLGVIVGIALALAISAVGIPMPPLPNSNIGYTASIRIVPSVAAVAFGIGFCATMLAALLPARRVAKIEVAEALRENH